MAKIVSCILAIFLLVAPFSANAQQVDPNRTVKVGYEPGYGMISNMESVDHKGYGYDLLDDMSDHVNFDFSFKEYEVGESLEALKNGEVDIAGPVFLDEINTEEFAVSKSPVGTAQHVLATKNPENYYYDAPDKLDGKTVLTYEGNPANALMEEYEISRGIELEYIYEAKSDYYTKEADLYLLSTNNDHVRVGFNTVLNLATSDMYLLTSLDNSLLTEAIDFLIHEVTVTNGNFLHDLYDKYYKYDTDLTSRSLTREEDNALRSHIFSVGYVKNDRPFQYDANEDEPTGISIEILNSIAEDQGFKIEYTGYDSTTDPFPETDILISTLGNHEKILANYKMTNSYSKTPMYLMTNEGAEPTDVKRIASVEYTTLSKEEIEAEYPNSEIIMYSSFEDAVSAFNLRSVDAMLFTNTGYANDLLDKEGASVHTTQLELPLVLFVSNDLADEFVPIFNVVFSLVAEGHYIEVETRQSVEAIQGGMTVEELIETYWPVLIMGAVIIVLIIVAYTMFQRGQKEKAIVTALNYDKMTGLPTMHKLEESASKIIAKASSEEYEVISLDIDYFRLINTLFGLDSGAKVLKTMADVLKKELSGSSAQITRIYADQFGILRKTADDKSIEQICEEKMIPAIKEILGKNFSLSMSLGVCKNKGKSESLSVLLDRANVAKAKGKSRHMVTCYYFDELMEKEYENRTNVTYKMEKALEDGEFKMVYQPKISLDTLKICGAEALVRWMPPQAPPIWPDSFIPVFEANGFIHNLDMYVFDMVCAFIKENERRTEIPHIAVNLSAITIEDELLTNKLMEILNKHGVKPEMIEIELTESAMVDSVDTISRKIHELRSKGFTVSIDDFGKGTSSLGKLSSIDIDIIKMDKDFLDFSVDNKKGGIVVEDMIRMAKRLDMKVVSECIETASQASWLKSLGCDMAQGYYFEKPLTPGEFVATLKEDKTYQI